MVRTFLAIELPQPIRTVLVHQQEEWRRRLPSVSWIGHHALHVTLKFLGNIPEGDIDIIREAVVLTLQDMASFVIAIEGVGVFPNSQAPRIMWAGITSGHEQLQCLAKNIEEGLLPIGFPQEAKIFHPHVTVARIKKDHRGFGNALSQGSILANMVRYGSFLVEKITLFQSELRPTGSVYTPLWEVDFPNR